VPTSAVPVSQSERAALADLLEQLGPDQPTCCEGWTTRDLATHLVVRDRRPDAVPGVVLGGPFASWTQRVYDRTRTARAYGELVAELRSGPPRWLPTAWPALDKVFNTAEMVVHHEDVRRAQPGWTVRELSREDQDAVWTATAFYARRAAGRRGVVLRRSDAPGVERRVGASGRVVVGEPMELLLWAAGRRDVARVTVA
jgi:uncharacterized protein (TIGR03085 family)